MSIETIDAVSLLGIKHLIVDEFQDLNPLDLQFVNLLADRGVTLFVAGDDDQSVYSFRYASPAGIQDFPRNYPSSGNHTLSACFRCTPAVLTTAATLIEANPGPNRIQKHHVSLYSTASPPVEGVTHRWQFASDVGEARAIAESCRDLIVAGIKPRDILILLAKEPMLGRTLTKALEKAGVAFEPPKAEGFLDTKQGRLVFALLRIVCRPDDYVAHRVLLGIRNGIGVGTCNEICKTVIENHLNFKEVFYKQQPPDLFTTRCTKAIAATWEVCQQLKEWLSDDTLASRREAISSIIVSALGEEEKTSWEEYVATFPEGMTIEELREFIATDTDEQQAALLDAVYSRLEMPIPEEGVLPQKVRIMTMHGAKGLSARVVFIPGLEEEITPGSWSRPYPGLVLEAARLLYVSITRARAACILSYSRKRTVHGTFRSQTPSQFLTDLSGSFPYRDRGLTLSECQRVAQDCRDL